MSLRVTAPAFTQAFPSQATQPPSAAPSSPSIVSLVGPSQPSRTLLPRASANLPAAHAPARTKPMLLPRPPRSSSPNTATNHPLTPPTPVSLPGPPSPGGGIAPSAPHARLGRSPHHLLASAPLAAAAASTLACPLPAGTGTAPPSLLLFGPSFSKSEAADATRRFAAFLPDWNCSLVASLCYVDSVLGERAMHPCVRRECACSGVFYKDFGGSSSVLRVRVWIESNNQQQNTTSASAAPTAATAATATTPFTNVPTSSTAASSVAPAIAKRLASIFKARKPEVTMFNGGDSHPETVSTSESRKWVPNTDRLGGGVWEVTFRPSKITSDTALAQLKVTLGVNELYTPGFEVRTKPSDWLLLQRLPAAWTEADIRAFLSLCSSKSPAALVIRRPGASGSSSGSAAGAGAGATATTDAAAPSKSPISADPNLVAFVRYANRPEACGVLTGFKAKYGGGKGKGKKKKKKAAAASSATADAASSLSDAQRNVSISLMSSLNRMFGYDTQVVSALAPSCEVIEVVQRQDRPAFLPSPAALDAAIADDVDMREGEEEEEKVEKVEPKKKQQKQKKVVKKTKAKRPLLLQEPLAAAAPVVAAPVVAAPVAAAPVAAAPVEEEEAPLKRARVAPAPAPASAAPLRLLPIDSDASTASDFDSASDSDEEFVMPMALPTPFARTTATTSAVVGPLVTGPAAVAAAAAATAATAAASAASIPSPLAQLSLPAPSSPVLAALAPAPVCPTLAAATTSRLVVSARDDALFADLLDGTIIDDAAADDFLANTTWDEDFFGAPTLLF